MVDYPTPDESLIGYVRVSTEDQDCTMQVDALRRAGVHPDLICMDQKSGRTFKRDGLRQALKLCGHGSTLLFWKLDRLGRDLVEVIMTVNKLDKRGVKFRSLTEPHVCTEGRKTAMGRMFFNLTAMFGEMESLLISERTKTAMRIGKENGAVYGRQTFERQYVESGIVAEYQKRRESGMNIEQARKSFPKEIPRSTITKWKHVFEPVDDLADLDDQL